MNVCLYLMMYVSIWKIMSDLQQGRMWKKRENNDGENTL